MAVVVEVALLLARPGRQVLQRGLQLEQVVPDGAAQVGQVEAAEQAVPVGVVGLGAVQVLLQFGVRCSGGSAARRREAPSMRLCIQLASGSAT
jgi:hypothetical protein